MRKIQIMFLCLIATMMFGACIERGNCPRDWICQYYDDCPNGQTVYLCANPSVTSGGYRVGNTCYRCADINNIDYGGCDAAAEDAVMDCYASFASMDDSNVPLQERIFDPDTDSENSEPAVIDEKLIELQETLERFNK